MITLKKERELSLMRQAGKIVTDVLDLMGEMVRPGIDTLTLDKAAADLIRKSGGIAGSKGYRVPGISMPYPGSVCVSVNEEVVHGIPTRERVLEEGDIVSVDVVVGYRKYYADAARTFGVGRVTPERQALLDVTRQALDQAIGIVKQGRTIGDIGHAVESLIVSRGYGLVRDYAGHGIGRHMHEAPQIPNYGRPGHGVTMKAGMTLAIEPMVMAGAERVVTQPDGWTVVTADGSDAAHFEKTVLVTTDGAEILTPWQ